MRLILERIKQETADAFTFIWRPEAPLAWKAGQYLHYTLPHDNPDSRKTERFFTNAAAPVEQRVQITTKITDKASTFKKAMRALPIGGTIEATGPEGDFVADDPSAPMVFIAGGIGITPFRSIILDLDHRELPMDILLMYASATADAVFKDELEAAAARNPGLKIRYYIGDDRIDEAKIRAAVPDLGKPIFYVSGPEPMVESFEKLLAAMGVPEPHIKRDYFPGYDWP